VRLVLDTCIIVSAFRSKRGASYRLLELLRESRFTAIATPTLLFEYEAVLKRPHHRQAQSLSDDLLEDAIRGLAALIEPVHVDYQWKPQLSDPDDEMVLESATNGHANAIITFNTSDFLPAAGQFGIRVLTPGVIIKERLSQWNQ
jgi:putative PIN family toxin of toxin-antitoxin system